MSLYKKEYSGTNQMVVAVEDVVIEPPSVSHGGHALSRKRGLAIDPDEISRLCCEGALYHLLHCRGVTTRAAITGMNGKRGDGNFGWGGGFLFRRGRFGLGNFGGRGRFGR